MAFHGSRGTLRGRGPPRGRGGFRGRGGSSGSRGRGRGRGSFSGRGRPVFDSVRVADQKNKVSDGENEESSSENEEDTANDDVTSEEIVSSDEDDTQELPAVRPYAALLQSLAINANPQAKRRKLDINTKQEPRTNKHEDDVTLQQTNDVDRVDEAEEGPEIATDGLLEADGNDGEDPSDPFEAHFAKPDDNVLSRRLGALHKKYWITQKSSLPKIGKITTSIPGDVEVGGATIPATIQNPNGLKLKAKLAASFTRQTSAFDPLEQVLAASLFNYHDLLYCERSPTNSEDILRLTCLHAVNHIFKTRDRVIKNNARLAREESNDDLELRDQGFTRPKVLMILPTRQSCVRMVEAIVSLCEPDQQENRKRFDESYAENDDKFSLDKPEDFRELFAGNDDDMFRLGMKFTRKTVKYFSQFYNSDIILASPLGLRMAIGTEEDKKVDSDFLSSIEIVIVDQADALLMQNWEHVEYIFDHLNLQPKEAHGCDFSRVRSWYLDNNGKYFRQTIALTAFNTPELNTLFYSKSDNWAGKIKINANYPGALQELDLKIRQTFSRLESPTFFTDPDTRFTYFTTAIIPSLSRHSKDSAGTLIFIPSYLDFVRVRNYFGTSATTSSLSFGTISEYTSVQDVARARSHFSTGRHKVLLYTERAHHFRRYQLRGVKKIIMYGLPDNPIFYKEITGGYLGRSIIEGKIERAEATVRILFSKWDALKLERVAGTARFGKMIKEKGDTFDFL